MSVDLRCGDSFDLLKTLDDNSVDTVITDPPAGISFMGKDWDGDKGGRDEWIAWLSAILAECYRVAKPGAMLLCWALPRTSHWTGTAIENAGWEVRDVISHLFGSGFPKSLAMDKAIDRTLGAEREVVGINPNHRGESQMRNPYTKSLGQNGNITAPATPAAREWDGYGTALKPACEFWWLAMKPAEGTFAQNALKWGVAGLNVDAGRIDTNANDPNHRRATGENGGADSIFGVGNTKRPATLTQGRFPSHVVLSHSPNCNGSCADDCPVRLLDEQSEGRIHSAGHARDGSYAVVADHYNASSYELPKNRNMRRLGDTGGASRFFRIVEADTCESVNFAATSSSPQSQLVGFVQSLVAIEASRADELSSDLIRPFMSVMRSESSKNGARSTQRIVDSAQKCLQESRRIVTELLNENPVRYAEIQRLTSTTMIIQSLLNIDGFAESITLPITSSNTEHGAKGLDALRFRYVAKASRRERDAGLEGMPEHIAGSMEANVGEVMQLGAASLKGEHKQIQPRRNTHPTVKPVTLLEYLCNLTRTPTGGVVLDPFMGSGSTIVAAIRTGRSAIGFETKQEYYEIAVARAKHAQQGQPTLL